VLTLSIDERCAPVPRRLKGVIRVHPSALANRSFSLDEAGRHHWRPYAPRAHLEVCMTEPALAWRGSGYLDSNAGAAPLEEAFIDWTWSRAEIGGRTLVLYDVRERSLRQTSLALEFSADGAVRGFESPPQVILPPTGWRVPRRTRADTDSGARVVKTLEDAPFYSRSLLETRLLGARGFAIHEALDLDRFRAPWVQCLLPFRMPRIAF
jgi:carotenoid 1,2-hydratase